MAYRDSQSSYPPTTALPTLPTSPFRRRPDTAYTDNPADQPFQYSTAGPPTGYSELDTAWSQPSRHLATRRGGGDSPVPLVPRIQKGEPLSAKEREENPFGGVEESDGEYTGDLYQRSDWGDPPTTATGWSHSSWAGPTTAGTRNLDGIKEDEEWIPPLPGMGRLSAPAEGVGYDARGGAGPKYAYDQGMVMDSPGEMTPGVYKDRMPAASQTGGMYRGETQPEMIERRSTLPSVLDLDHLDRLSKPVPAQLPLHTNPDPFADPSNASAPRQRASYAAQPTPDMGGLPHQEIYTYRGSGGSAKLLSPEAHARLGRMSVAPARYTLPPQRTPRNRALRFPTSPSLPIPTKHLSAPYKFYLTYRPFLSPVMALGCALLLTVASGVSTSVVSGFVRIGNGVFTGSQGGGNGAGDGVGLGAWGWCQLGVQGGTCSGYSEGDFKNESGSFVLPGASSLDHLASLLTALTAFTWLLASFQIITAILHFSLFFALSIPFSHLVDLPPSSEDETAQEREARVEVDLRVKCERPPYEGYAWVWWAWWAHRRGPVAAVFGVVSGAVSLGTFIMAVMFKRDVAKGTGSKDVHYAGGTYVPLLTFILTLDTFIASVTYFAKIKTNLSTLTTPPDPSPSVLFLPSSSKPMQHIRHTNASSFFAPHQPTLLRDTASASAYPHVLDGVYHDPDAPPLPPAQGLDMELDPETVRWLAAYPTDDELVALIGDLRMGRENDDFLLSDVGLLYLRPAGDDDPALLVPPRGAIRDELISDAHLDPAPGQTPPPAGTSAHNSAGVMLEVMGDTFWWNGMAGDCQKWEDECGVCRERRRREEIEERTGMTAVPWTGVTGWTKGDDAVGESEMAAEMAVAMRRAQEEADRAMVV
ncbi:hypothetical protein IAT38_002529 [Cryptococcus sp. DSM 104549]